LSEEEEELPEIGPTYDDNENPETDLQEFIRQWEKEFDIVNANPEENSDFDSDNDVNPLDTLNSLGEYTGKIKQQITSENLMKRKPIQLSIVGKPNTGKSTLVNTLV